MLGVGKDDTFQDAEKKTVMNMQSVCSNSILVIGE